MRGSGLWSPNARSDEVFDLPEVTVYPALHRLEKAGFLAGDTLVAIGNQEVTDLRTYSQILRTLEPGQTVDAKVLREGEEIVLPVTVEKR